MIFEDFLDWARLCRHTKHPILLDADDLIVSSNQIPIGAARQMVNAIAERIPLSEVGPNGSSDEHTWDVGLRIGSRWLCMFETADSFVDFSKEEVQLEVDELIEKVIEGEFDDEIRRVFPLCSQSILHVHSGTFYETRN